MTRSRFDEELDNLQKSMEDIGKLCQEAILKQPTPCLRATTMKLKIQSTCTAASTRANGKLKTAACAC